jgi:hypothetical protein
MISASLRKIVLALFAIGGTTAGAASDWPPLPSKGFVAGRPAQKSDVENGDAVFVAAIKNVVIGKPLPIPIPQYALLRDTTSGSSSYRLKTRMGSSCSVFAGLMAKRLS